MKTKKIFIDIESTRSLTYVEIFGSGEKLIDIHFNFLSGVGIENQDIVDLKTAKRLKELGFNKPTHWYWLDKDLQFVDKGLKRVKEGKRRMNHNKFDEFIYSAPSRKETLDWFNNWIDSRKYI